MALVGNVLLGTGAAPGMSSIASAYAESAASSRIPWSALEYSGQTITAISGSAIGGQGGGGGVTPADVSAIASSYANDKLDKSASSTFAPSGDYAYASSLSSYLPGSASSNFAPSGDYAYNSSLSGKLDNSASSTWYPMAGNPSGFLTAHQSLTGYTPKSAISSQSAVWNTVTGKVNASDISAQSATWNTVSARVDQSAISAQSATWNTVTAKADATAVHTYTGVSPVVVNNTTDQISLSASSIHLDTSLRSYVSGNSGFIGMAYPMQFISNSSEATGSNILYVVIGG